MSRTIWAVTDGEYDDYRVEFLFETEDDARRAIDAGVGDNVEQMILFGPGEQPRKVTLYYARAEVCHDPVHPRGHNDREPYVTAGRPSWELPPDRMGLERSTNGAHTWFSAEGEDRDATLKLVTDAWSAFRAAKLDVRHHKA